MVLQHEDISFLLGVTDKGLPATCTVGHFQTKRCLSSIQRADGYTPDLFVLYKEQNWFAQADDLFFSVETLLEDGDEFGDGFESIDRLDEFDYCCPCNVRDERLGYEC